MPASIDLLSAHDVVYDLTLKLQATERLVDSTLQERIERCTNQGETLRLKELKIEFELEIAMIRMNLKHLMTRYSRQLEAVRLGERTGNSASLPLDAHEAVAVENARTLYHRTQELAT
ncbi:hypothetical protein [Halomonas getboli]|uniref:hypothetical protein n=1 Tax=Halomonas getboli TaxID=2935862 RepID=UPI001FFF4EA3|nr:hypothetical protein [Halomonas getboli]MCK2185105.1 hypothetical protein [Halomonas getboli]